jgi:glucose/arabinose dehydrogenase
VPAAYQVGAVLATHGSNDHVPPKPAEVYWLPWNASAKTLGTIQSLLAGFIDSTGDRWGKPVDVAAGPDGSLYVSDDVAGAVYRLTLPASAASASSQV